MIDLNKHYNKLKKEKHIVIGCINDGWLMVFIDRTVLVQFDVNEFTINDRTIITNIQEVDLGNYIAKDDYYRKQIRQMRLEAVLD